MAPATMADPQAQKSGSKNRRRWIWVGGAALLVVGLALGAGLWRMQAADTETAKTVSATTPDAGQTLLPIGRITVNVSATSPLDARQTRFLVIEPSLLYHSAFDMTAKQTMAELQPALRDSYIEFLSQLHENDVYGSAGLAQLRAELLRRARLVSDSDAPISILLQDFVLQ